MARRLILGNPPKCQKCGTAIRRNIHMTEAIWRARKYCSDACRIEAQRGRPIGKAVVTRDGKPAAKRGRKPKAIGGAK
jgi:hypothetical protein